MAPVFTGNYFGFGKGPSGPTVFVPDISATGGSKSSPGDGYTYHTSVSTLTVASGTADVECVIIGDGGGGGGSDGGGGATGGGGGTVIATVTMTGPFAISSGTGGGGGGAQGNKNDAQGGPSGPNGGGQGGRGGPQGHSGGGGGGGGWSWIYIPGPNVYLSAAGGGGGGGGANEGGADNTRSAGGGDPTNIIRPDSTTGHPGQPYPGDGGGWGGCGGGYDGDGGGGGYPSQSNNGGANYLNPSFPGFIEGEMIQGGPQGTEPTFRPANPLWAAMTPTTVGDGGGGGNPGSSGQPGWCAFRYLDPSQ